jgi:hypothetical protein
VFAPALGLTGPSQVLTGFSAPPPFYNGTGFNLGTGQFTVPTSGKYAVKIMINYATTASISASLGSGVVPGFSLNDVTTASNLLSGTFPLLDVNIALVLDLRVILGAGQVLIVGDLDLVAGNVLQLVYEPGALNIPINLSGPNGAGVVWSMFSLD